MPTPIFAMMPCNMGIFTLRLRSSAPREVPSTHVSATQKAVPVIALFVIMVVVESLDAQYSAQVADVAQPYTAPAAAPTTPLVAEEMKEQPWTPPSAPQGF